MYRTLSLGPIVFDPDPESPLEWTNEHDWTPVGQTVRYALAGNVHVAETARRGRPVDLVANPRHCWLRRDTALALAALAETPGQTFALTLRRDDGPIIAKTVAFDRTRGPFEFAPVDPFGDYLSGSIYLLEV